MTRTAAAIAATLLIALGDFPPASACSICRCGDPTFNALGTDVYSAGKFRLAVDWDRFDKENSTSESEAGARPGIRHRLDVPLVTGRDEEVENRVTATLSYSFGDRVTAVARVPWSSRRLTTTDVFEGTSSTTRTRDLSDPEIYALVRLWASPFTSGLGRRAWVSLVGGVKTPWGRNDLSEGGQRLDEHAQSGTGATDVFGGVSGAYLLDPTSSLFASVQYRRTGTNDHDYRYGNVTLFNVAYERKLARALDAVLELNYRHAQQDRIDGDGTLDPNTGGDVLYLTPRVILDFGRGLLGRVTIQVPLVRSLYGDQTERFVVNAGITYLF
jgi:hypothetical protein